MNGITLTDAQKAEVAEFQAMLDKKTADRIASEKVNPNWNDTAYNNLQSEGY